MYKRQVPLESAGQLAGDPRGGLVSGVVAVGAVVGGQAHDDVALDQALDEVDALSDLVGIVVQARSSNSSTQLPYVN